MVIHKNTEGQATSKRVFLQKINTCTVGEISLYSCKKTTCMVMTFSCIAMHGTANLLTLAKLFVLSCALLPAQKWSSPNWVYYMHVINPIWATPFA